MRKYRCRVCGEVFEASVGEEIICPKCGARGNDIEPLDENVVGSPSLLVRELTVSGSEE